MNKSKKVLSIILLCFVISCGIAYLVLYCLYPTATKDITWQVIDYICNKPLPVIGVSTLMVGAILFKIISFAAKNKGWKYNNLSNKIIELKTELEKTKEENEQLKQVIYNETEKTIEFIKEVCNALPNKKVKLIGEKYGKERTDNKTETEEI